MQLGGEILKVVPWEGGVKELLGSAKCKYIYKVRRKINIKMML